MLSLGAVVQMSQILTEAVKLKQESGAEEFQVQTL